METLKPAGRNDVELQAIDLAAVEAMIPENLESDAFVSCEAYPEDDSSVSSKYLFLLTIGLGGLQIIWTSIMSQGSPYLFSLGVPAYVVSLVWLAGPLCGTFLQPYIGVLSDQCQHSWGRRKPFIVGGTIGTIICMMALPWSATAVHRIYGHHSDNSDDSELLTQIVAIFWIWALNIALQPLQSGLRALTVDCTPKHQQADASAHASCIIGAGSIVGYAVGAIPIPRYLPWLGDTNFKGLCAIASLILGSTVAITCFNIKEQQHDIDADRPNSVGPIQAFGQIWKNILAMSSRAKRVCLVQFFSWIGWFTFLFYITTYIGELFKEQAAGDDNYSETTRFGTFIMVFFAINALLANLMLPLLVNKGNMPDEKPRACGMSWTAPFKRALTITWLTLPRAWCLSQITYLILVLIMSVSRTQFSISGTVIMLGIPWAMTQWAPLALISMEIAGTRVKPSGVQASQLQPSTDPTSSSPLPDPTDFEEDDESITGDAKEEANLLSPEQTPKPATQTGALLGVYNAAIAMPQIAAAVGSSAIFWVLAQFGITGFEAIVWVIRAGALAAAAAAWLSKDI